VESTPRFTETYAELLDRQGKMLYKGNVYEKGEVAHAIRHAKEYTTSNSWYNPWRVIGLTGSTEKGRAYDSSHPSIEGITQAEIDGDKRFAHDEQYDHVYDIVRDEYPSTFSERRDAWGRVEEREKAIKAGLTRSDGKPVT